MESTHRLTIRQAERDDLGTYCLIWNTVWPEMKISLAEMERDFEHMPAECRATIWLASVEGRAVGFAECHRDFGSYHPQKWTTSVAVLDGERGKGVGRKLYEQALTFVQPQDPVSIATIIVESDRESVAFAVRRGFAEIKRDFESRLNLLTVSPALLEEMDSPEADIRPAVVLDSPEFRRELHAVFEIVRVDTPRTEPPTPMPFENFNNLVIEDPDFLLEGSQIALVDGKIAGFTGIFGGEEEGELFQWLTAVKREYRGQGLAKAMKARAARWAIANGYRSIHTDNDTRNAPMLAINKQMGFERRVGTVTMLKRF